MTFRKCVGIICMMVSLTMLANNTIEANAATYGVQASSGTYKNIGSKSSGDYNHTIAKNSSNWILFYPYKKCTNTAYHIKGHGYDLLSYSQSVSVSTTKTTNWSVNGSISASASGGVGGLFEATVSCTVGMGYGESYAEGITITRMSDVTRQIKDEAPTGYYARVPGYTFYKMRSTVLNTRNYSSNMFFYDVPYGDPVIYTIYSRYNDTWSLY